MFEQITLGMYWSVDWHKMQVTKMFKDGKCQITETWISEDTGRQCKHTETYGIGGENNNQYAYALDYQEYKLYANSAIDVL